jgi:hypothetical protein
MKQFDSSIFDTLHPSNNTTLDQYSVSDHSHCVIIILVCDSVKLYADRAKNSLYFNPFFIFQMQHWPKDFPQNAKSAKPTATYHVSDLQNNTSYKTAIRERLHKPRVCRILRTSLPKSEYLMSYHGYLMNTCFPWLPHEYVFPMVTEGAVIIYRTWLYAKESFDYNYQNALRIFNFIQNSKTIDGSEKDGE